MEPFAEMHPLLVRRVVHHNDGSVTAFLKEYTGRLSRETGAECRRERFRDGDSPRQAYLEDLANGL